MSFEKYEKYIHQNREAEYSVFFEPLPPVSAVHKWVGAQSRGDIIYGIPNDMCSVLKHADGENRLLGKAGDKLFKWTGGCIWDGFLYGFPRTSNYLLKMRLDTETIEYIPVKEEYSKEHHYGGVCTKAGMVYQPPRDSDHILVWDLNTGESRRIYLVSESEDRIFRYCGSIMHPNGWIYILPEKGERIIKLDTRTEAWEFMDNPIDTMVFDAKTAVDGNIYGYSAYCRGILKIDVERDHAEMIHTEVRPGAYGTKLGINGHLYSVPGDGRHVWDYDPLTDSLKSIYQFSADFTAKFAGGVTMRNGDIYAVPARESQLLQLKADKAGTQIPDDVYQDFFVDAY